METTIKQIKVTEIKASGSERKFGAKGNDSRYAPSRVFVDFGEDVWTHLANRRSRDYTTLKPLIAAKLTEMGIEFTKISWNRYAGCSMCLGMNPDQLAVGERSASTSNRNFEGRQGKGGRTHLVSPLVAAATALRGKLSSPADL